MRIVGYAVWMHNYGWLIVTFVTFEIQLSTRWHLFDWKHLILFSLSKLCCAMNTIWAFSDEILGPGTSSIRDALGAKSRIKCAQTKDNIRNDDSIALITFCLTLDRIYEMKSPIFPSWRNVSMANHFRIPTNQLMNCGIESCLSVCSSWFRCIVPISSCCHSSFHILRIITMHCLKRNTQILMLTIWQLAGN